MAPWTKEVGPLGKSQKEVDLLKKKVDLIIKESNKVIKTTGNKNEDKDKKLEEMYQKCIDAKKSVENLHSDVEKLKEEGEPTKLKDFEKKKLAELNRLGVMKTQLGETMSKILPNTNEAQFLKSHLTKEEKEKEEEDEDEDGEEEEEVDEEEDESEEEDDGDEEEEEETTSPAGAKQIKPAHHVIKKQLVEEEAASDDEDEDDDEDDDYVDEEEEEKLKISPQAKHGKKTEAVKEEEEEDDDEDDDDDDDDDDEESEEENKKDARSVEKDKSKQSEKKGKQKEVGHDKNANHPVIQFITIDDYEGEEDGDLDFKTGEILTVVDASRDDGWWLAKNQTGKTGLVPSTYLKEHRSHDDDDDENDDDEEESEEEEGMDQTDQTTPSKRSGKKLWQGVKKALAETTVSDVLHAMGAVPSGFRPSTLCRKFNEGDTYRFANYLMPKLSQSNLTYKDLFFDPATNKIRPRPTRIERVVTLVSCQQIPPPGAGLEVTDRHVRMCLFDGTHILSNIHAVRVSSVDKTQRVWSFMTKMSELMDPSTHAEVFVRTSNNMDTIGVLFELCISYTRTSTSEKGEFSCGWVHVPLLDETGTVIPNRSFDLTLNGGTPYEKGVEVDPSISRRTNNSRLVTLISGNKQPKMVVKITAPKQQYKDLMDTLPDTVMGNTSLLPFYSYYRHCLADTLLRDRLDLDSTELIHSPVLKVFPKVADIPDLMKVLRVAWFEKLQDVKRTEKPRFAFGTNPLRDEEYMKDLFKQVVLETVYPLSHLALIPEYIMGDTDNNLLLQEQVARFCEMKKAGRNALAALLSEDLDYKPFEIDEAAFNIIGPYCVTKSLVTAEG